MDRTNFKRCNFCFIKCGNCSFIILWSCISCSCLSQPLPCPRQSPESLHWSFEQNKIRPSNEIKEGQPNKETQISDLVLVFEVVIRISHLLLGQLEGAQGCIRATIDARRFAWKQAKILKWNIKTKKIPGVWHVQQTLNNIKRTFIDTCRWS